MDNLWDVKRALIVMHGMEQACRLLIADLDRELIDRDSYRMRNRPRSIGIAVVTTVQCALFCEYAIKTFHSLLSDGKCHRGHKLDKLYDLLGKRYLDVTSRSPGVLDLEIQSWMASREACCPSEWHKDASSVRSTLNAGAVNFEDWRYGYPEQGRLEKGLPKGLFAIAKALELLARSHFNVQNSAKGAS